MLIPGLVSVTLRALAPEQIVALTAQAGLRAIEWGGDVHVPPGHPYLAHRARQLTLDAGLAVSSYGSYHRLGQGQDFGPVLDTALALGAPTIRVWAGTQGSPEAGADYRCEVARELGQIGRMAAQEGVTVALEFHDDTLTDTAGSTLALLEEAEFAGVRTYWQPPHRLTEPERLADLDRLAPWVSNLHVFHWTLEGDTLIRHPLADGADLWRRRLARAAGFAGDRYALLEFVAGDDPRQVVADAQTLRALVETIP